MASFTESIDAWVAQTKERLNAVHGRSVELLGEELAKTKPEGGKVPFIVLCVTLAQRLGYADRKLVTPTGSRKLFSVR